MSFQKYRGDKVVYGDRNIYFFYVSVAVRKVRNKIVGFIIDDGKWVDDKKRVKVMVVSYYEVLFAGQENKFVGSFIPTGFKRLLLI